MDLVTDGMNEKSPIMTRVVAELRTVLNFRVLQESNLVRSEAKFSKPANFPKRSAFEERGSKGALAKNEQESMEPQRLETIERKEDNPNKLTTKYQVLRAAFLQLNN